MKILFFVEPLIVRGSPDLRLSWILFAADLMATLEPEPRGWPERFRIVTSEHLRKRTQAPYPLRLPHRPNREIELPDGLVRAVSRGALRDLTGPDAMHASAVWYEKTADEQTRAGMAALVREAAGDFEPEVVVTFSAAPFLRDAYPDAAVLTHESGMVSRPPFPPTFFFDPLGTQRHSLLRQTSAALCSLEADDAIGAMAARIRRRYLDEILIPRSPFAHREAELRRRFDSLWVLPLQGVGAIPMDAGLPFRDQFDYVSWVLDTVGPRVGVILTQHPAAPYLTEERGRYFMLNHPNAVILPEEAGVRSSTHFMLGIADGIINLVSNTGLQSLLWRKKIATVGNNQTTGIADTTSLESLTEVAHRPWDSQKDAILIWLLTHYYRTSPYLYDKTMLTGILEHAVTRRHGPFDLSYFRPMGEPEEVIERFVALARPDGV